MNILYDERLDGALAPVDKTNVLAHLQQALPGMTLLQVREHIRLIHRRQGAIEALVVEDVHGDSSPIKVIGHGNCPNLIVRGGPVHYWATGLTSNWVDF